MHEPELAMLPIGGRFMVGPRKAAKAAGLLGVGHVGPKRCSESPTLTGSLGELGRLAGERIRGIIRTRKPGETLR